MKTKLLPLLLFAFVPLAHALDTAFTVLDIPDYVYPNGANMTMIHGISPTAINDSGQVAGRADWGNGWNGGTNGFVETNGTVTEFSVPDYINNIRITLPTAINASGQIVGTSYGSGFIKNNNSDPSRINVPNEYGYITLPTAINDSGLVAGSFTGNTGESHGFVKNGGTYTILTAPNATNTYVTGINASGQVVGHFNDSAGYHGFVETNGVFTTLTVPNATNTYTSAINASGQVAGIFSDNVGTINGFVEQNGIFTTLTAPNATNTYTSAINANGQVVGFFIDNTGSTHDYIEQNGIFTTLVPNAVSSKATGINANGQVVGVFNDGKKERGFVTVPISPVQTTTIDLSTTLSQSSSRVKINENLTYTATVINNGTGAANNVALKFMMPPRWTNYVSLPSDCVFNGTLTVCNVGSLTAGATVQRAITVSFQKRGAISMGALVTTDSDDSNLANNMSRIITSITK